MTDIELLALSYLPLLEALIPLDDVKLEQELVRRYYVNYSSYAILFQLRRPDLIQILLDRNLGDLFQFEDLDLDFLFQALSKTTSLVKLIMPTQELHPLDLQNLVNSISPNLKSLSLWHNNITDDCADIIAEFLETNSSLTSLAIRDTKLSSYGYNLIFSSLIQNTTLTQLNLIPWNFNDLNKGYLLTNASVLSKILNLNSSLKDLSLDFILDPDNFTTFALGLKNNKGLRRLRLEPTRLAFSTGTIYYTLGFLFFGALAENKTLEELDIDNSSYSFKFSTIAKPLTDYLILSNLTSLKLDDNHIQEEDFEPLVRVINRSKTLKSLSLALNDSLYLELIYPILAENRSLTHLDLHGMSLILTSEIFIYLDQNPVLTSIDLSRNELDGGSENWYDDNADQKMFFEALGRNKTLKEINLQQVTNHRFDIEELTEALKINTTLISLNIAENVLYDVDLEILADAIEVNSSLTKLNLSGYHILGRKVPNFLKDLVKNHTLTEIQFGEDMVLTHVQETINLLLERNRIN